MKQEYNLAVLEERIGYRFQNIALLKQAITHSSFTNEQKINKLKDYERLEFLGDAVLELVSSEFLFHEHADVQEGELTKMRASMVCEPSLAFCARDLELGEFLLLGKGEDSTGGRKRASSQQGRLERIHELEYSPSRVRERRNAQPRDRHRHREGQGLARGRQGCGHHHHRRRIQH